jgi:transposase-like protein
MRGKNSTLHSDPADPPRRRANKRTGHGTYAKDRPPIISVVPRDTGEHRFWVCNHADTRTCPALIAENVPPDSTMLYTDEWQSYRGSPPAHATVRPDMHEWARADDRDGRREVHCNTVKGLVQHFGRTCAPFVACISSTCICMWRRMKP